MGKESSVGNTVLVVEKGGRGTVLAATYARSEHVERIIAVPGNDLMQINTDKTVQTYPKLKTTSVAEIVDLAQREQVGLVDVAQDNAVEAGLVDALMQAGIPTVGPTGLAGKIEWDKAWARLFGRRRDILQPDFQICYSQQEGFDYLDSQPDKPRFVKAAFLAEGKGALPAKDNEEAKRKVKEVQGLKNNAGNVFLIEEWLKDDDGSPGEEFSTFALSDGERHTVVGSAQDHKRAKNFDEGDNTGGMGCSSPPLVLTPELMQDIERDIFDKTFMGLYDEGRPHKGVLYLGGMIIKRLGKLRPYVIEFNARWGDPEAQVIVPGIVNDFFEVGMAIAQGDIRGLDLQTDGKARVVVAGVSKGYPGDYSAVKGKQIYGLDDAKKIDGVGLYGAGVKEEDGKYYANGGRLFYIVGEGENVIEARRKAYGAMSMTSVEGNNLDYRTDIGWRDVARLHQSN